MRVYESCKFKIISIIFLQFISDNVSIEFTLASNIKSKNIYNSTKLSKSSSRLISITAYFFLKLNKYIVLKL